MYRPALSTLYNIDTQSQRRVFDVGVGVQRRSLSFPFVPESQPASRSMASALLLAAVPSVVLWSNRRAAGVRLPAASARRGVHDGGAMFPFFPDSDDLRLVRGPRLVDLSISAFKRKLLEALSESL